jgi:hypothetical protein
LGWVLAGITLFGLLLRIVQLDLQPLWWDEGYSVFFATRDVPNMLALTALDIHPPAYYLLLKLWISLLGSSAFALRSLSVVIGSLCIPLAYVAARRLFDRRTALLAALLVAIAPLDIFYSQEVRMYGLVMLLALASVDLQLELLRRSELKPHASLGGEPPPTHHRRLAMVWEAAYVVSLVLLLYTQYLAVFLIAAQAAVVLYLKLRAGWNLSLGRWAVMWLVAALLYLPWVIYAAPRLYSYVTDKVGIEQYAPLDPLTFLIHHLTAFSVGHPTAWPGITWGALVLVGLAGYGLYARHFGAILAALYLFVPLGLAFLLNLIYAFHPVRYERLLLFAAPFFLMLGAHGLVLLFDRQRILAGVAASAVVILCAMTLYDLYTEPRYADEDYRPLVREMEQRAVRGDLVYAFYPWQVGYLESYYHGEPLNTILVPGREWTESPAELSVSLDALRRENPRAWVMAYQTQGRILEDRVLNEYVNDYIISDQHFGNTRLAYFTRGNDTPLNLPAIKFAPGLQLRVHSAAFDDSVSPALAFARLAWTAATDEHSFSLRIVDSNGDKIVQEDAPITPGTGGSNRALVVPRELPPGDYSLQLVVYRRADSVPLSLPTGAPALTLATFTVAP